MWQVFRQEEGLGECLRYAVGTACQIDPNDLPVSGTILGNQAEGFSAQLEARYRLRLVREPADWRPDDEGTTWIASVKTKHGLHAVCAIGTDRLLCDPDGFYRDLPVSLIDHALRIEPVNLAELTTEEILELAITLTCKPASGSREGRELMERARMLVELDGLSYREAFPLAYLDVDLPEIRALLRKGSTPEQALRILL
jgi:hypothetical protein